MIKKKKKKKMNLFTLYQVKCIGQYGSNATKRFINR